MPSPLIGKPVPEFDLPPVRGRTFLIDARGRIVFKQIGPITPAVLEERILPLAREIAARPAKPLLDRSESDGMPLTRER